MSEKIPQVKTRRIHCRFGCLDFLEVPTDWRKASGIVAKRNETNMGLAKRDYSVECETGSFGYPPGVRQMDEGKMKDMGKLKGCVLCDMIVVNEEKRLLDADSDMHVVHPQRSKTWES